MGLDIYRYQVQEIDGVNVKPISKEDFEKLNSIYDIDDFFVYNLRDEGQEPPVLFVQELENKTGKRYSQKLSKNILELPENLINKFKLENSINELFFSYSILNEKSLHSLKSGLDFENNPDFIKNIQDIIDLIENSNKNYNYIKIDFKDSDFELVDKFILFLKENGAIGDNILMGKQEAWYFEQNSFIVLPFLLPSVNIEFLLFKAKTVGYQRKGYKNDLSFFKQFYGNCWYVIEDESIEEKENMEYCFDNNILKDIAKTFLPDTPIQKWKLEENEYIYFSA